MNTVKWLVPLAMTCAIFGAASAEASTCTSAQYGSFTIGSTKFNNDMWGTGHYQQTICASSATAFSITSNQPSSPGGVKAYGDAEHPINRAINSIGTLTSTISQTTPGGGSWDAAYDIWDTNNAHEIMVWMNYTGTPTGGGNAKPIAYKYDASGNAIPTYTNVNVGGATWNVYEGHSDHDVISFLRTTKTNNTTTDLKAILAWIEARGYFGNVTITKVQYGVEVGSTSGNETWNFGTYSLNFQ